MTFKQKLFHSALVATVATSAIVVAAPQTEAAQKDTTKESAQQVTREQLAQIIADALKLDTVNVEDPGFTDVKPSHPNYGAIAALQNAGIVSGFADGSFGVKRPITREQLAKILVNGYGFNAYSKDWELPFADVELYSEAYYNIGVLYNKGIMKGVEPTEFGLSSVVTTNALTTILQRIEQWQQTRVTKLFSADELGVTSIDAFDYTNWSEDDSKEIFQVNYLDNAIEIEAVHQGTGSITLNGYNEDENGYYETVWTKKYIVTVTNNNGQFDMVFEETSEISPGSVLFFEEDLGFKPQLLQLSTVDGTPVNKDAYTYAPSSYGYGEDDSYVPYELKIKQPGEYVAVVSDRQGNSKRVGIEATESDFRIVTSEVIETGDVFISTEEIGFAVTDYQYEQYTGAITTAPITNVKVTANGISIKPGAAQSGYFSLRLLGKNNEIIYVHGMARSKAGITSFYYDLSTEEDTRSGF